MTRPITQLSVDERLDQLSAQLAEITGELRRQRQDRERWQELADDLAPVAAPAADGVTALLEELNQRGYFGFARQSAGILDTIVSSFTEEDVKLLGDNIVLILRTLRQMTQPEVMGMLNRTALTIAEAEAQGPAPAPSTLALLRQMRDPLVRRGLGRALATLRALGAESESVANPATPEKR
ncbi:MAG TPA: DUF1641 domain-containing protein [Streptosporangiaceae bacterium]